MAGLLPLSALALGMLAATQSAEAAQNVANTKHNLSNQRSGLGVNGGTGFGLSGVGDIYTTGASDLQASNSSGSDQICVFCHTPHGSNVDIASVPLWNRSVRSSSAFQGYKAYTMIGSNSTGTASVGGMSLACLSCHDGTQAMDAMFNAPGSGPGATNGGTVAQAQLHYTWTNDPTDTVAGKLNAPITMLGTDLSNDHPIGMGYCGGASSTTCADPDFKTGTDNVGRVNGAKIGALKLFGASGSVLSSTVECATCHDPHMERSGTTTGTFLRVSVTDICLTCHTK